MSDFVEIKNTDVFRGPRQVFQNVSLSVEDGQHTAVLGPNGAGKTTLIKLLCREIYPVVKDNSHIKLFGQERFHLWDLRKKIGVVSQEFQNNYAAIASGLDVVLSAYFGSVGIHSHNHVTQEQHEHALQLMEQLNIKGLIDKQYLQLSSGQQRRLLLARAQVHNPQLYILDEPTNSLDIAAAFDMIAHMRAIASMNKTLLLVTHHLQEIVPEIQRIIILKEGKIVFDGHKTDALQSRRLSEIFECPMDIIEHEGFYNWVPRA